MKSPIRSLQDPVRSLPVYALEKARLALLGGNADEVRTALIAIDEALRVLKKGEPK